MLEPSLFKKESLFKRYWLIYFFLLTGNKSSKSDEERKMSLFFFTISCWIVSGRQVLTIDTRQRLGDSSKCWAKNDNRQRTARWVVYRLFGNRSPRRTETIERRPTNDTERVLGYLFVYNLYRVLRVTDPFAAAATTGHKANPVDCKADGIPGQQNVNISLSNNNNNNNNEKGYTLKPNGVIVPTQ